MASWYTTFSFAALGHRLQAVPMLLIVAPFILGILLYESYVLPLGAVICVMLLVALATWLLIPRWTAWCYAAVAIILLGYTIAELRAPHPSTPYNKTIEMEVSVESTPLPRSDYSVAEGRITSWSNDTEEHRADDRVVLWLRTDSITFGDRLTLAAHLTPRISRHASYDRLMHRRGIVGGVGINSYNILHNRHGQAALSLQQRATERLRPHLRDTSSYAIVKAMVAGSRDLMPAPLREAYATTGLAHLMAVSGLHLGIVMVIIATLLLPLRLLHHGHRIAHILTIVAIWLFATMSGLSPSVIRAALMLSILQLALAGTWRYNSLNALCLAAFAMLIYRPNYLYDISFELSVMAVAGIVLWAIPLIRHIRLKRWLPRMMATTILIGIAATLWTLPLVSHTFGNMPVASIVLTPAVMLFAYIIVICGILSLILPTSLASTTMAVAEWAAHVQNSVVEYSATLPYASINHTMSEGEVMICYATYIAITLLAGSINRKKVVTLSYADTPRHRTSQE